ncbi:MAG: NYN domain-containing protein [Treponemataceae bacterium]|nr:NYN domain-containing protein [Treponemataceae bacterium]
MMMEAGRKIAVFIDAENISAKHADKILMKIGSYGNVLIQRAYADWSANNTSSWKDFIVSNPVQAIQQFHWDVKESVDKAIIMDGVECAIKNPEIDTFCLVASDKGYSDFVLKLRALGKYVLGIGERQKCDVNLRYVKTFNEFVYIEDLEDIERDVLLPPEEVSEDDMAFSLSKFLAQCFDATPKDNEDSVLLSRLGETILRQQSDFDYGKFGFRNLVEMAGNFPDDYEVKKDPYGFPQYLVRKARPAVGLKEMDGFIFRQIECYGFVCAEDDSSLEFFYYRNDAPKDIRDKLKKGAKVRCKVLKDPEKGAGSSKEKNGRVEITGLISEAPEK